jgi:DNA-binding MarR family transcriptional regulator
MDWLTPEQQRAWRGLISVSQLLQQGLDRQLQRDAAMPHAYYAILVTLSEADDRSLPLAALAEHLGYSLSRLSHAVTTMATSGWVERRPCPGNRRVTWATLTPDGAAALIAAAPGHVDYVRRAVFAALAPADVAHLERICSQVLESLHAER